MFADDTKLYTVLTDRNANLKLNNDMDIMQTWSRWTQMTFNIEKCKVLHLGSNNPNHQYTLPMSGEEIHTLEETMDEKDPEVTIDNQLKFSMQVQTDIIFFNNMLIYLQGKIIYWILYFCNSELIDSIDICDTFISDHCLLTVNTSIPVLFFKVSYYC